MSKRIHKYNGISGLDAIAKAYGHVASTLRYRINQRGMTIEEAINAPLHERNKGKKANNVKNTDDCDKGVSYIAIRQPYEMSSLWRVALGMGGCHE
ncbi:MULTISPECIES: hypothetical protein [Vibrio]|uniref:DNA/RNA-binding protein n=2 Tax=Vibrio anguillarum TaxID=55601 RepID=A0A1Y0NZ67_VIBAN|nr:MULTISPECIES: hypothetical protein [Vibrio]ARB12888.1 DNA/RNA-binding protein [Vibrio phage H2 PGK-2017]ARB12963.1 DNA/RNA-binding protein [Vibrio phage H8]ARB13055.1 DNA/RNA-binding protein [Vibrio phage H20]ARB13128.1 DNA/RNA-binding protein [Vibrio phage P2]ARB13220.1 DNA/RNA-binding protein [Vibrio phage P3]ARB13310.1 DNA/RNA-binding protein [Vibrio phage pVa-3]ARB13401.1 DNA/RNA-binding protein [Vibrio phage pVa-4]ARB13492.1 DNA/RNA-binding protein [Vibrio phage pVa-8]ARH11572.1 DN